MFKRWLNRWNVEIIENPLFLGMNGKIKRIDQTGTTVTFIVKLSNGEKHRFLADQLRKVD